MKILVAGATGCLGRALIPQLSAAGHKVLALSRSTVYPESDTVENVHVNALDRDAMVHALAPFHPEVVINLLTNIPRVVSPRVLDRHLGKSHQVQVAGLEHLLDATAGAHVITPTIAWMYAPSPVTDAPAMEGAPLWDDCPPAWRRSLATLKAVEKATLDAGGCVTRLGHLLGPATAWDCGGHVLDLVKRGKLPIVAPGTSRFSFVHTHDAASGIVAAAETLYSGVLNLVDGRPAQLSEWLPELAESLRAPAPKVIPHWMAQPFGRDGFVAYCNQLRAASNERARRSLGWEPTHVDWRESFRQLV